MALLDLIECLLASARAIIVLPQLGLERANVTNSDARLGNGQRGYARRQMPHLYRRPSTCTIWGSMVDPMSCRLMPCKAAQSLP